MPSYKNDLPDQEYLDSIKKHTDKETNKVNLALVAKDFGYASGKSFQKNQRPLPLRRPPPKWPRLPPKPKETKIPEAEKSVMDIVSEHLKAYSDKIAAEKKGKSSEEDKKKKKKQA
ncbi:hypothetical protein N7530_011563 [Penicillium desertorum]|uniref:Uncharacterized protein n=1 Tax=Penicillium desertorum TaxID=1303715 RepID=A0A9W9WDP7_9EURO|nr:hypothetical protein N7530_011563 [Penicillium desertorum]